MNVCTVCEERAEYRHRYGSLLTYWWVEWRCYKHKCDECQMVWEGTP